MKESQLTNVTFGSIELICALLESCGPHYVLFATGPLPIARAIQDQLTVVSVRNRFASRAFFSLPAREAIKSSLVHSNNKSTFGESQQ
jgi:hypothetical protein